MNSKFSILPPPGKIRGQIFLELVSLLTLLIVVNVFLLPGDLGFHGFNPNPLWLLPVLMASRYGTGWGWLASALAGAAYFGSFQLPNYLPGPEPLAQTFSFFVISLFLGEFRNKITASLSQTEKDLQQARTNFDNLQERFTLVEQTKEELVKKNMGQTFTVGMMYRTLQDLQNLDAQTIYKVSLTVLRDTIETSKSSLYIVEGDSLKLKSYLGYEGGTEPTLRMSVDMTKGYMGEAIRTRKLVSRRDLVASKENTLDSNERVMSAPLLDSKNRVIGVLNVDDILFFKFTSATVKSFSLIAQSVAVALEKSREYDDMEKQNPEDPVTLLMRPEPLQKRLQEEFERCQRYGATFSIIVLELNDIAKIRPDKLRKVLRLITITFRLILRTTDIAGRHDKEQYLLLLPFTPAEGVKVVAAKIGASVAAYNYQPYDSDRRLLVKAGCASFERSYKSIDEIIAKANQSKETYE